MKKNQSAFYLTHVLGFLLLLGAKPTAAQMMPAPDRAPRAPVSREHVAGQTTPTKLPTSKVLSGQAEVLDAGRIGLEGFELRLFGVVPPLVNASYGPQARALVDALAAGQTTCHVRDRERSGQYLATCQDESQKDFGLELLRRGLAATARGTLGTSEYARPYLAAEQAAQAQGLGLWSLSMPKAASSQSIRDAAEKAEADKHAAIEQAKLEADQKARDRLSVLVQQKQAQLDALEKLEKAQQAAQETVDMAETASAPDAVAIATTTTIQPAMTQDLQPAPSLAQAVTPPAAMPQMAEPPVDTRTALEKYQLFFTGLLLVVATSIITAGIVFYKLRMKNREMRAIAAALRGELLAARSMYISRLSKITGPLDDRAIAWPRIRILVFQAYVGRLGELGANLARKVASIYGMSADYASYYGTGLAGEGRDESVSKTQALKLLIQHIDDVTPLLLYVEEKGEIPTAATKMEQAAPSLAAPKNEPLSLADRSSHQERRVEKQTEKKETTGSTSTSSGKSATSPQNASGNDKPDPNPGGRAPFQFTPTPDKDSAPVMSVDLSQAKSEIVANAKYLSKVKAETKGEPKAAAATKTAAPGPRIMSRPHIATEQTTGTVATRTLQPKPATATTTKPQTISAKETLKAMEGAQRLARAPQNALRAQIKQQATAPKTTSRRPVSSSATTEIDFSAPLLQSLSKIRNFTSKHLGFGKPSQIIPSDFTIPDYANLTEEELEALLYADEAIMLSPATDRNKRTG